MLNRPSEDQGTVGTQTLVLVLGLLGFAAAYFGLRYNTNLTQESERFANTARFEIWVLLVGAGSAFSAIALALLWRSWAGLRRRYSALGPWWEPLLLILTWSLFIALPLVIRRTTTSVQDPPLDYYEWRVAAQLVLNLAVMIPAILSFRLITLAASRPRPWNAHTPTPEVELLSDHRFLQGELRSLLAIVGGVVTLRVLENGAFIQAVNFFQPEQESVPAEVLYPYGALLAAAIAILYIPAFSALQRYGHDVEEHLCPLPPVADPTFITICDKRSRLEAMLGLDASAKKNLESGVLILTPLIGSILTTFLPG